MIEKLNFILFKENSEFRIQIFLCQLQGLHVLERLQDRGKYFATCKLKFWEQ